MRETIVNLKESVYESFRALQGFSTEQLMGSLSEAVNNKDYDRIGGAFSSYTSNLQETAGSKEEFYRGIAEANALVQGIDMPDLQEEIATSTASTAASAATIARINEEAAAMYEELIAQNETMLPMDEQYYLENNLLIQNAQKSNDEQLSRSNTFLAEITRQNNIIIQLQSSIASSQAALARLEAERFMWDQAS